MNAQSQTLKIRSLDRGLAEDALKNLRWYYSELYNYGFVLGDDYKFPSPRLIFSDPNSHELQCLAALGVSKTWRFRPDDWLQRFCEATQCIDIDSLIVDLIMIFRLLELRIDASIADGKEGAEDSVYALVKQLTHWLKNMCRCGNESDVCLERLSDLFALWAESQSLKTTRCLHPFPNHLPAPGRPKNNTPVDLYWDIVEFIFDSWDHREKALAGWL